jgi:hypothetical protein
MEIARAVCPPHRSESALIVAQNNPAGNRDNHYEFALYEFALFASCRRGAGNFFGLREFFDGPAEIH